MGRRSGDHLPSAGGAGYLIGFGGKSFGAARESEFGFRDNQVDDREVFGVRYIEVGLSGDERD